MVLNIAEQDLKDLDEYFGTKHFLFIFPLKRPAIFFLWLYTIFFGFFVNCAVRDLFQAGVYLFSVATYIRIIKCILIFMCFVLCSASLSQQRAIRGAFGCIYFFTVGCIYRVLLEILTTKEQSVSNLYNIYLNAMYNYFKSVENSWTKYFGYFMFTLTVTLGWHISMVVFSYHRQTWIPINPALEGNVADLHIESANPQPSKASAPSRKKKKANKRRLRRQ